MGHLYHGYVGHNQRVGQHPLKHSVVQQPSQAADNEAVEYFEAQTMMASGRGEFQGGTGGEKSKSRTAGEKWSSPTVWQLNQVESPSFITLNHSLSAAFPAFPCPMRQELSRRRDLLKYWDAESGTWKW